MIKYFVQAAEKVKIINIGSHTGSKTVFKTNECKICALARASKIILRSSTKFEVSEKLFFSSHLRSNWFRRRHEQEQWISHIFCSEYDFYMIFTHKNKSQATNILIIVINIIKVKYSDKMIFIRSDEKRSLKNKFANFIAEKNIIFKLSASDTSVQTDHIERKEDILLAKEKAMRIKVDLSIYPWSWITQIVEYPMNKITAYLIDKHIFRKKKMRSKAYIDFLIEYDNINIFNIWILNLRKVIRTRDVIFDENSFYKLSQIDSIQMINESFLINDDTLKIFKSEFIRIKEL